MEDLSLVYRVKRIIRYFGLLDASKVILLYCYKSARSRLPFKTSIVKSNGFRMHIIPGDVGISAELLMFGNHEPITTKLVKRALKEGMICLDIGANIGYYVLLESQKIGKNGKIFAFEPSTQNFKVLSQNLSLNEISNVEIFNFACGDADGKVNFLTSDRSNWSRVDEDYTFFPPDKIINEEQVPIRKIDSFIMEKKIDKIDFVRMDTDGYEVKILDGMWESIKKFKPLLCLEIHRNILGNQITTNLLKKLQKADYEIVSYTPRNLNYAVIGKVNHVKQIMIDELIEKINKDLIPATFSLFLAFQKQSISNIN